MEATKNIFEAAMNGNTEDVKDLLAGDKSLLNAHSTDGWTALHLAAHFGRVETMAYLIEQGADVNIRSNNSLNNNPLHAAAASRHTAACELLLQNGADINAQQHGGYTALHATAQHGDEELAQILLARGADKGITLDNGQTALDIALANNHESFANLLR